MARKLEVEIVGDASSLERAFGKAGHAGSGFGTTLGKVAKVAGAAALAIGGGLAVASVKAVNAASNLDEQINKTNVVFGKSGKEVVGWSKQLTKSFGLSSRAALEAAGTYGNMLVPMGFSRKAAGEMSKQMVELAGDMASFNNASPTETLDALRAGLAGESEPLRRFGVFLNDARLKQEALSLGLYSGKGALDASAKAQATYSLILKDTADTQGDFARTSDSVANQQRILKAEFENVAASVGKALLPAATALLGIAARIIPVLADWGREIADRLGPAVERLSSLIQDNWPAIQRIAQEVFGAVGRVISEVADVFRGISSNVLPDLQSTAQSVFSSVGSIIESLWKIAQPIFSAIRDIITNVVIPVLSELWDIARTAFDGIARVLKEHEPEIRRIMETIGTVMRALGVIIREVFQNVIAPLLKLVFGEILPTTIGIAITAIDKIITIVRTVGEAFVRGFEAVRRVPTILTEALGSAVRAVTGFIPRLLGAGKDAGKGIVDGVASALSGLVARVRDFFHDVWQAILDLGKTAKILAGSVGRAIVEGVVSGIKSLPGAIGDALVGLAQDGLNRTLEFIGARSPSVLFAQQVGLPIAQGVAQGIAQGRSVVVTEAQQLARDAMTSARETLTQARTTLHDIVKADDFLTPAQISRANTLFRQIGIALRDKSITEEDLEAIRGKLDRLGEMAANATEKMAAAVEAKRGRVVGAYDHLTSLITTGFQRLGDDQIRIQEETTQRSIDEYTRALGARTDLTDEARSDMVRIFETQARETLAIWTRNYSDMRTEQEHHLGLAITNLQTKLQEGQISAGKFQTELKKIMSAAGVDTKTQAEIMGTALSGNIEKAVAAVLKAMGGFATGTKTHFDTAEGHASRSLKKVGDAAQTARGHLGDMSRYESEANATLSRIQNIARSVTTGGQLPTQYQAPGGEQPAGTSPAGSQLQLLISRDPANAAYYRSLSQTQRTAILRSMGLQSGVRNWRGGWALVGESGAEMVNLPRGSDVYPAQQTAAMLGGGGGGGELTVRAPVYLDSRQIGEVVYQYLLDRSRSSGSLFSASPGVRL